MSEIDDIFSKRPPAKKKSKAVALPSEASTSAVQKKKSKSAAKAPSPVPSKKRPAPETILDPSSRQPPQKKTKVDKPPVNDKKDTENFKDSRGTGPRMCSASRSAFTHFSLRTEDGGRLVYIQRGRAGHRRRGRRCAAFPVLFSPSCLSDTPLCPFDCDCCKCLPFMHVVEY